MFTTASFLVAGSNLMRGSFTRFLGELEVERLMIAAARRGHRRVAITLICSGGACVIAARVLTTQLFTAKLFTIVLPNRILPRAHFGGD